MLNSVNENKIFEEILGKCNDKDNEQPLTLLQKIEIHINSV